jgi:hypothetical protein
VKIQVGRPSPALVVALLALIVALGGTAYAAHGKNSVGTRQLKAKSVTNAKLASGAVTAGKVAPGSLTGADIALSTLGTVPSATSATTATNAQNASTLSGHAAACPVGATLIRSVCFDSSARGPVPTLAAAADGCASAGGYLPTPMELYSTRATLNLGTGVGADLMYTDSYYSAPGSGYLTIVVDDGGATEQSTGSPARYICTYPLVR